MDSFKPPLLLIAEDDIDDLYFFESYFKLEFSEWKHKAFKDGVDLLSYIEDIILRKYIPTIIVLDMNMPRLNGLETLQKIKLISELDETKILGYSSSNQQDMIDRFYQLGGTKFIEKPYSVDGYESIMKVLQQMHIN